VCVSSSYLWRRVSPTGFIPYLEIIYIYIIAYDYNFNCLKTTCLVYSLSSYKSLKNLALLSNRVLTSCGVLVLDRSNSSRSYSALYFFIIFMRYKIAFDLLTSFQCVYCVKLFFQVVDL
jgi:hypothetical protein